jgi:sporulation-control protein spo0M
MASRTWNGPRITTTGDKQQHAFASIAFMARTHIPIPASECEQAAGWKVTIVFLQEFPAVATRSNFRLRYAL